MSYSIERLAFPVPRMSEVVEHWGRATEEGRVGLPLVRSQEPPRGG